MNRRGFLGLLASVAAGAALDPDRALWVPGAKLISIPRARPFLAVGDIVTFGPWPEEYIVTAEAFSVARIDDARFRVANPRFSYPHWATLPVDGLYSSVAPRTIFRRLTY